MSRNKCRKISDVNIFQKNFRIFKKNSDKKIITMLSIMPTCEKLCLYFHMTHEIVLENEESTRSHLDIKTSNGKLQYIPRGSIW